MNHKILELYSGIGGMHNAWRESGLNGDVICAVDINTVANEVYHHNFPTTKLFTKNIQSFTPKQINQMDVDTILMSPPCQPFTRNGKYLDENDTRTNSFLYIMEILDQLENINYILLENVKGFECSVVRNIFVEKLKECKFDYQEFLLCPSTVGIPNSRLRYYCIARKHNTNWNFKRKDEIMQSLPLQYDQPFALEELIETDVNETFLLEDKLLKRANILDICYRQSRRSCCFTKAYSHYVEGTGSVFTECSIEFVQDCFYRANQFDNKSEEFINIMKDLKLRFFTPTEVLALMAFPKKYSFPNHITRKQCYRLLGNSINVKVVSELIRILFDK